MSNVWIWILMGSFLIDGIIRIAMYLNDKRETYRTLNRLWQEKSSLSLKDLYKTFMGTIDLNLHRFGIVGTFSVDNVNLNGEYVWAGDTLNIGLGIIKNKSFVGTDDILSSMQNYVQNTGQSFDSTVDAIEDKYIVEIFLKHDIIKQFLWDDKDLFNNVDIGDEVTLAYSETTCTGVGYLKKGDKNVRKNPDISS